MKVKISEILLVILSGVLTAFSFPKFSLSFFAWVSLIPLLAVILNKSLKESFILGLAAGFSFYAILIYWIPSVPAHYGGMSTGLSIVIYLLLVIFLALYWGVFALVSTRIHRTFPKLSFLLIPFIWVSFEYILTYFLTGFPWGLLGTSQYLNIYFIQLASVAGVYGLSFALVLFQSLFLYSMKYRKRTPFFAVLAFALFVHGAGFLSLKMAPASKNSFRASVIQGNVSSDIYWNETSEELKQSLFDHHLDLSRRALDRGARLLIWPEFTIPLCFSCPVDLYQDFKARLFEFVKKENCTLVLGTNETAHVPGDFLYFNTALCLRPDLSMSHYYKMHLVPFGEYTPYKKIFFFIERMTHAIGDISPGTEHLLHRYQDLMFGSPICYEIIFPSLVRKFVKKGANFLVTITNDGWYGKSSAPYQHFSCAVLRAVENRRYLLRAATTGISGIIDPYGRILSKSELMTSTCLVGDITPSKRRTLYTRWGDILPQASLTLSLIFFILTFKKKTAKKRNERKKARRKRKSS